ncbi:MAG: biotin synthase BioB [Nitrospirae bacterium]|nr:biotin synthase BioB [Nitrospirota bacterium]
MISTLVTNIVQGGVISRRDILGLNINDLPNPFEFFNGANIIRENFRGNFIDLCSIVNAKSGGCSEDCVYCAQSSISKADIERYPLKDSDTILRSAIDAANNGARRFCIVTGGRKPTERDLDRIVEMIPEINNLGLKSCATLGLLNGAEFKRLKDAGLHRFHHNLESSERFFPNVCTTHSYQDKIKTIIAAKEAGLSVCCGAIFGIGETWQDRIDLAFALREIGVDSIPINFLTPISGTILGMRQTLDPLEALKVIALNRYILPKNEIRVCGGRMQTLNDFNAFIFMAGADGLLIGNYLTTIGRLPKHDIRFIKQLGFTY